MKETILKYKLSIAIAYLLWGIFSLWIGVFLVRIISDWRFSILPVGISWVIGLLCLNIALPMILLRNKWVIKVSSNGLYIPPEKRTRGRIAPLEYVSCKEIIRIIPHIGAEKKGIDIVKRDGQVAYIPIEFYCSIRKFIKIVELHKLPVE